MWDAQAAAAASEAKAARAVEKKAMQKERKRLRSLVGDAGGLLTDLSGQPHEELPLHLPAAPLQLALMHATTATAASCE